MEPKGAVKGAGVAKCDKSPMPFSWPLDVISFNKALPSSLKSNFKINWKPITNFFKENVQKNGTIRAALNFLFVSNKVVHGWYAVFF